VFVVLNKHYSIDINVVVCCVLQLSRLLFGNQTVAGGRVRRSTQLTEELEQHLADLTGTKASLSSDLAGTSMSLIDRLMSAAHVPTGGVVYQLIRDNPQLMMNPEMRRLLVKMIAADGRHEMDSWLQSEDVIVMITLMHVSHTQTYRQH